MHRVTIPRRFKIMTFCYFHNLPVQVNISGNENADKLAKKATTEQTTEIINTPFDDFKRNIRTHIRMNWEQTWNRNSSHLREIKNNTIEWTSSHQLKRKESIILTRLRIGHSRITHGHFARKESESTCTTCGIKTSVKHIIIDCPKYDEARIESKIANSLFVALGDDQTEIKKTISFINKAQLTNEIWINKIKKLSDFYKHQSLTCEIRNKWIAYKPEPESPRTISLINSTCNNISTEHHGRKELEGREYSPHPRKPAGYRDTNPRCPHGGTSTTTRTPDGSYRTANNHPATDGDKNNLQDDEEKMDEQRYPGGKIHCQHQ